ncbi:septation protein SepH [Microterricola viridarii]|uniref:DNA-binding protein n=1 Tax=Microterricola viridarii TaxID=412690 RepID=A0A120I0C6_9MICO|nr:septation protein SepH [Microterricola viridarii]AMB58295.1 DNA-binding protein [Microterricola viridarii]
MQELKVIGVENGALLVASDEGDRYRIVIDDVLQSRLRQAQPEAANSPKLSPREVQAYIRSGMSADDVAAVTGASLEYIQRFEGPVVAEREHMVSSALGVPVHTAIDPEPADEAMNFGTVIRERLASLGAHGERWASWKEPAGGWVIKLAFTADGIDHDARWGFEPKKLTLSPLNSEAVTLSQQGEISGSLIPRLRAVGHDTTIDESRFDSGAFTFRDPLIGDDPGDVVSQLEPMPYGRAASSSPAASKAAIKRADEPAPSLSETADLLEALRRRRGEREAASSTVADARPAPTVPIAPIAPAAPTGPTAVPAAAAAPAPAAPVESPAAPAADSSDSADEAPSNPTLRLWGAASRPASTTAPAAAPADPSPAVAPAVARGKKGRASMPSWDEIVFGARTDDDLA